MTTDELTEQIQQRLDTAQNEYERTKKVVEFADKWCDSSEDGEIDWEYQSATTEYINALRRMNELLRRKNHVATAALHRVEAVADREFPEFMTDVERTNSDWFKQVHASAWGNAVHMVQQHILMALGIKPSAEEWLDRKTNEQPET